jgi:hypothetical protein
MFGARSDKVKKGYLIYSLLVISGVISACTDPQSLTEQETTQEERQVLVEAGGEALVLDLDALAVQINSVELVKELDEDFIVLNMVIRNQTLPEGIKVNEDIFSISAQQADTRLSLQKKWDAFSPEKETERTVRFKLNSKEGRVVFSFHIHYEGLEMTKHYDVFLS